MGLTLRNTKGSPLTATEMDNNLTYLETVGTASGSIDIFTGSVAYPNINKLKFGPTINATNISGVVTLDVVGSVGGGGTAGTSGTAGSSGSSGTAGSSGTTGTSGSSGTSGGTGSSGSAGTSGTSGTAGSSGTAGLSGDRFASLSNTQIHISNSGTFSLLISGGLSWTPGQQMIIADATGSGQYLTIQLSSYNSNNGAVTGSWVANNGTGIFSYWAVNTVGAPGASGTSGISGTAGTSGTNGTSGSSGSTGTAGSSGSSGLTGSSGTSGISGSSGSSGINGTSGSTGTAGTSGSSGTNGTQGSNGSSGTGGSSGSSGSSGSGGSSGSSGTGGGFPFVGEARVNGMLSVTGSSNLSGSTTITGNLFINNGRVIMNNGNPTSSLISGSSQVDITQTANYEVFSSSLASRISSAGGGSIFSLTGSNQTAVANVSVTGSFSVRGNSTFSGSVLILGPIILANSTNSSSIVSGSEQVDLLRTTNFSTFSSSIAQRIASASSGGGGIGTKPIVVQYNTTQVVPAVELFNFTGPGVTVTNLSSSVTINITTGSGGNVSGSAGTSGTSGTSGVGAALTVKSVLQEFAGVAAITFTGSVALEPSGSNGVLVTISGGGGGIGGTSGTSGTSAIGSSGTSGINGFGSSGTSGTTGTSGSSGSSGLGSDGTSGTSGTSATAGSSGIAGTSGINGTNGTSGFNGTAGTSGTSITLSVKDTGLTTISNVNGITFSGSFTLQTSGSTGVIVGISSNLNVTGAPGGTVSGSAQITELGFATTSSNAFKNTQTVTGSLFVSGSQVTLSSSVWAQSIQLPYSWSLILPLAEGWTIAGSPQGYAVGIRTSSFGGGSSSGPFTQTATNQYTAIADLVISGSVKVTGSISASGFAITSPGTPEIASATDIILNAGNAVKIASSSLKLTNYTDSQTGSLVAENGALIYNSTTHKFMGYANGSWVALH